MSTAHTEIPPWVVYPEEEWVEATPDPAGFDAGRFKAVADPAQVDDALESMLVAGPVSRA